MIHIINFVYSDQENDFNELLVKLSQQQLKLKSKLSSLEAKIDCVIKQLKETTTKEKNEIMSQYKVNLHIFLKKIILIILLVVNTVNGHKHDSVTSTCDFKIILCYLLAHVLGGLIFSIHKIYKNNCIVISFVLKIFHFYKNLLSSLRSLYTNVY